MANPRMTAEIGRVLGGRYRLVAPIGMGASAQVYLADDVRLRRRVAVKMLHDALADDAEFLRRFRAEARAAAALSHPNVMAVFDWGDDEVAFIVTEYLSGGSLRALLDRGDLLTPSQALVVGLDATRALDYAHRRGFVHRDIKPANLLFGEEQRLRIADFGLARALAEAAWTEPQGAVLGTARYASPEQAKGEKLTGKADVYSLALTLIEAVTGEVPFTADTTLGTLMARVDRPLEVPDALEALQGVLVRAGHPDPEQRIDARTLAAGLLRAAKALPRPAPLPLAGALVDAAELAPDADPTIHVAPAPPAGATVAAEADLTDEDLDLDPPDWVNQADAANVGASQGAAPDAATDGGAPAPIASPDDAGPDDASPDDAGADEIGRDRGRGAEPSRGPGIDPEPERQTVVVDAGSENGHGAGPADGAGGHPGDEHDAGHDDGWGPAGMVAAAGVGAAVAAGAREGGGGDAPMIDLTGEPITDPVDVVGHLSAPSWAGQEEDERRADPVDRVVDPTATIDLRDPVVGVAVPAVTIPPTAGPIDPGRDGGAGEPPRRRHRRWPWVLLVLAVLAGGGGVAAATVLARDPEVPGPPVVLPVPTLTGRAEAEARAAAEAAGWKVARKVTRRDGSTKGQVLASTPAPGSRLASGRTVTLLVSAGQEIGPVPQDLAGKTLEDATALLARAGFTATVTERPYDEEVPEGSVLHPADGTPTEAEHGSPVGLVVSAGPQPRVVPNGLQGSTEKAAREALAAVQLEVAVNRQFHDDIPEGQVVSVSPRSGTTVPRGETITIEVSRGPELRAIPNVRKAKTLQEAAVLLQAAGFTPRASGSALGRPVGTDPPAGTKARPGTTVTIILG